MATSREDFSKAATSREVMDTNRVAISKEGIPTNTYNRNSPRNANENSNLSVRWSVWRRESGIAIIIVGRSITRISI